MSLLIVSKSAAFRCFICGKKKERNEEERLATNKKDLVIEELLSDLSGHFDGFLVQLLVDH